MTRVKLSRRTRAPFLWAGAGVCLVVISCSIQPQIPSVGNDRVESLLRSEAAHILTVSEDWEKFSKYQFLLAEFPREDILGMSVGNRQIYISYKLASLALTDPGHRWLLRQTVAHEIAHEIAGHAKQKGGMWFNDGLLAFGASGRELGLPWYVRVYNYPKEKELEADLKGLGYWKKLGWDCRIWVQILKAWQEQGYSGDSFHPTATRLQQARRICESPTDDEFFD